MNLGVTCIALAATAVMAVPFNASAQDTRYIVQFSAGRSAEGTAALRGAGAEVLLTLGPQQAVAARIPARALQGLQRNPNIEYIEVDQVREPLALWNDTATADGETVPFGIRMVQADLVSSTAAANRTLCIIDSGYSQQHDDLKKATSGEVSANQTDSGSGSWDQDSCGHGTHVAGTVAAINGNATGVIGVNPGVELYIVKVFGNNDLDGGSCSWTYSSTLVNALNKCVDAGSNVVSMSLGGGTKSRTEERAFANADASGVLSIAAAGNSGNRTVSYPAGYASVVSVAAVDANETVATFSQFNRDVEIAAPGVSVLSTVPWLDANTLAADGVTWTGGRMDGAARTGGTSGAVVDGGLCTSAGAWGGAVVLCQRGEISFADKVKNVQSGGGLAAAIYNNQANDASCGVFAGTLGDSPTTTIPAITMSCADGAAALTHLSSTGTVVSTFAFASSGYESWDGTSMATPHVSAVAALIWSCDPFKSNKQIRDAMNATAKDKGSAGRDNSYGYGIVQAKDALLSLGAGSCTVK